MNPLLQSIVFILSLAAIAAVPLAAENMDSENAKRRAEFLLAVREKERLEEEIAAREPANTLDIVDTAATAGSFKTLVAALEAAGLADTLKGEGPFTVFAPTDEAFSKYGERSVNDLLMPANKNCSSISLATTWWPVRSPCPRPWKRVK